MPFLNQTSFAALLALSLQAATVGPAEPSTVPPQSPPTLSTAPDFQRFRNPELFQALFAGDMRRLSADKIGTMLRLLPIISALEAPDAWYRIGMDAEAMLDPQLAPVARGIVMSDTDMTRVLMTFGLSAGLDVLTAWTDERRRQTQQGIFDVPAEITALNRSMIRAQSDMARLAADGAMDAKRLMLVARDDPQTFMQIYEGLRQFVYGY
ncbi:hypothetical protein [Mongoliimonas terrestris]|uniref:hypothetical protein n=1 Tax=Mongoliimonas terrestris TaxID=1709001 RepID=UPI000A9DED42|nr:hypothetical protein [Mongoliimonas terrestris]